jgi:CheY-like chemotaxis protein
MPAEKPQSISMSRQIMVVDDDEFILSLYADILASAGYEVACFTDSLEALAAFTSEPDRYSALVSDQSIPGMTGAQLSKAISVIRADLFILLCSGSHDPRVLNDLGGLGINQVLLKPIKPLVLLEILRENQVIP